MSETKVAASEAVGEALQGVHRDLGSNASSLEEVALGEPLPHQLAVEEAVLQVYGITNLRI